MLRVGTVHARPGMILALPVFHPNNPDTVLLKAGVALDARIVARLREMRIGEVWIRFPGTDFIAEHICPGIFRQRAALAQCIAVGFDRLSRDADAAIEYAAFKRSVAGLLEKLIANPRASAYIQQMVERQAPLVAHASNVCYISLLMGLLLRDHITRERPRLHAAQARDVSSLGVGAMLADIGMLGLSGEALRRWNAAHDESDPEFQQHVRIGYDMVRGHIDPSAAAVVLHHHQRFDGTGFPADEDGRGQLGSEIHVYARIVAAADLFNRLRTPAHAPGSGHLCSQETPVVTALSAMLTPRVRAAIDPMVFRALINAVPPYPPGTVVKLSTGQTAAVTLARPTDPCRPCVVELRGAESGLLSSEPGDTIDLQAQSDMYVAEVSGHDVSRDNFYPASADEFDIRSAERVLTNRAADDLADAA